MGLSEVKQEVLAQAEKQSEEILAQARAEAAEISRKAEEELKEFKMEAEKHHEQLSAGMEKKLLATAHADAQRLVLDVKKTAFEVVLANVKEELANLNKTQKSKFLNGLRKKAEQEIKVSTVFLSKDDQKIISKAKTAEISGGLIAENKEGTISINLSVEEILTNLQAEVTLEMNEVLFK